MTIGIAHKFGKRVLVLTDTMITDSRKGGTDAIPGRLKAIILSPTVSVAYAGHSDPALKAIQDARQCLQATGEIRSAFEVLIQASASPDHEVEFLLIFHQDGEPHLQKVTARGITADLESAFIGDAGVVRRVLDLLPSQTGFAQPDLGIEAGEGAFWNAFSRLFVDGGTTIVDGVGGLPISMVASPYGHFYSSYAVSTAWDVIDLRVGITPAQHQSQRSGETAFSFNIMGGRLRGVAALGVAIPQAGVGFIYSPLAPNPTERLLVDVPRGQEFIDSRPLLSAVSERLEQIATMIGGGVEELALS